MVDNKIKMIHQSTTQNFERVISILPAGSLAQHQNIELRNKKVAEGGGGNKGR